MKLTQGIALSFLMALGLQASAKTINPTDLVIDGGYSLYEGASQTTQLFVDKTDDGSRVDFWVKVIVNPGTDVRRRSDTGNAQAPVSTVYIKHFPVARYMAVLRQLKKISNFGVVNPYIDGAVICDAANSTIRRGNRKVIMAYNCGADAPDADTATFNAEALLKALRTETMQAADLQGPVSAP